jgi:hypothetical protein
MSITLPAKMAGTSSPNLLRTSNGRLFFFPQGRVSRVSKEKQRKTFNATPKTLEHFTG